MDLRLLVRQRHPNARDRHPPETDHIHRRLPRCRGQHRHRNRPNRNLLRQPRLHRHHYHPHRPDRHIQLDLHDLPRTRNRPQQLQRPLEGRPPGPIHRALPDRPTKRRRSPPTDRQQDRNRRHDPPPRRKNRHHQPEPRRRPALRHRTRLLQHLRHRNRQTLLAKPLNTTLPNPQQPALPNPPLRPSKERDRPP